MTTYNARNGIVVDGPMAGEFILSDQDVVHCRETTSVVNLAPHSQAFDEFTYLKQFKFWSGNGVVEHWYEWELSK